MPGKRISINRAPVLTLWAAVVAERLGYEHNLALTLGKAVAGLNAQSKGLRLGIFEKPKTKPLKVRRKAEMPKTVTLMGRLISIEKSGKEERAKVKEEAIDPASVQKYLEQKFGDDLDDVRTSMHELAKSFKPENLAAHAYGLYEKFRPTIPAGEKGWGAKGVLDLGLLTSLKS